MRSLLSGHLLSFLTFLPLAGAVVVALLPRARTALIARAATAVFGAGFVASLPLWTRWWDVAPDAYGYRFADHLMMVVNASNIAKAYDWIKRNIAGSCERMFRQFRGLSFAPAQLKNSSYQLSRLKSSYGSPE